MRGDKTEHYESIRYNWCSNCSRNQMCEMTMEQGLKPWGICLTCQSYVLEEASHD